jgi:hypothetical protein
VARSRSPINSCSTSLLTTDPAVFSACWAVTGARLSDAWLTGLPSDPGTLEAERQDATVPSTLSVLLTKRVGAAGRTSVSVVGWFADVFCRDEPTSEIGAPGESIRASFAVTTSYRVRYHSTSGPRRTGSEARHRAYSS